MGTELHAIALFHFGVSEDIENTWKSQTNGAYRRILHDSNFPLSKVIEGKKEDYSVVTAKVLTAYFNQETDAEKVIENLRERDWVGVVITGLEKTYL
jgi:hypothetical protein